MRRDAVVARHTTDLRVTRQNVHSQRNDVIDLVTGRVLIGAMIYSSSCATQTYAMR
jgi:hypothetical protein